MELVAQGRKKGESVPMYRDYPKIMRHPAETPATIGREMGEGTPIRFPPVTVNSVDQEEEYLAKGYKSSGDAAAFQAVTAAKPVPGLAFQEYPKWVSGVLCQDEEDEMAVLEAAESAEASPPVLGECRGADPYSDADTIRAALTARAEARGVKVDRRWSLERLIAEANGAAGEEAA